MESLSEGLLAASARACAELRISEARLASLVVNDGKFFVRVRAGGGFTTRTYERFLAWFREHCPAALNGHGVSPPGGDIAAGRPVKRSGRRRSMQEKPAGKAGHNI